MLIQSYGLFWRADEIDWHPDSRARDKHGVARTALLGHRGVQAPTLEVADFWRQQGIYILYGNYGPHYVGLATTTGLGRRLRDHLHDRHKRQWDRFSWFGFRAVRIGRDRTGISLLASMTSQRRVLNQSMIREMEALLIYAMGLSNITQTRFPGARRGEWQQVLRLERESLIPRLRPGRYPVERRRLPRTPA